MIETTCRFCMLKLIDISGVSSYDSSGFKTVSHTRRCNRCMVTQSFNPDGKPTHYSFEVSPYILMFDLSDNQFSIREQTNISNILMKCNFIPYYLTPKTTTLEKIKTLILFS